MWIFQFCGETDFDGYYQRVLLVGDRNAIDRIDLNRPYHSSVKKHDSRLRRFKKLEKILYPLDFFDIAKNTPQAEPTH